MTRQNIVDLPLVREGSLPLPEDEAALVGGMLEGYYARKKGARRKKAHYVRNEIKVVCEFIRFVGKVPWDWTEDDFDKWCLTLSIPYPPRAKALGENSQRKYQGALRRFLEYLTNNVGFQTQVQNLYGKRIYHICPKDACVVHTKEEEEEKPRRVFTFNEIETFMSSASRAIREAVRAGAKNVRVLQRDRAVWA
ncbi:MAG: hypothetical protein M1377_08140, partial [Deltaproteobacteria bacterium]|nr:hypothetical protein [Deltaproteobacteria bacterium]